MPLGVPRDEEERIERHKSLYGEETEPPEDRLRLGPKYEEFREIFWDLLPALPFEMGPLTLPLPRGLMRKIAGTGRKIKKELEEK